MKSNLICNPDDQRIAVSYLRKADPALGNKIDNIGDFQLEVESDLSPFEELLRSIVYQQLSGRAAETIYSRLLAKYPNRDRPQPEDVLNTPDETLRSCGLSASKVRAVKDLADKTAGGELPDMLQIKEMDNRQIIDAFTSVWGIGQWTVEMLLMFNLGRADVLPAADLGIRRGFSRTFCLDQMPSPQEILAHGEIWRPYRSVASWYLWRVADSDDQGANRA